MIIKFLDLNYGLDDHDVVGVWFPVGAEISVFSTAPTLLSSRCWLLLPHIKWPKCENGHSPPPSLLHTPSRRDVLINSSVRSSIHCTDHMLLASVYCTVGNAFKGIINLEPFRSEQ
jgi:hypothetical protein